VGHAGRHDQGDLASWIVAGSYKSIASASHAYDLGLSYSTQQYDGGNADALVAIRDSARNVGSVYGFDQWTVSPRFIVGYGTAFARYDYLDRAGLWSPRVSVTVPIDGFRLQAVASQRALVPGAEEFAPSVNGLWLPPERTFSSIPGDGGFRPEQTRHLEVRSSATWRRAFRLRPRVSISKSPISWWRCLVHPTLLARFNRRWATTMWAPPAISTRAVGAWDDAGGDGLPARHHRVHRSAAYWQPSNGGGRFARAVALSPSPSPENVYDLQATVEATIPQTSTKLSAKYRVNNGVPGPEVDRLSPSSANTASTCGSIRPCRF
jgi:hypothetical protein